MEEFLKEFFEKSDNLQWKGLQKSQIEKGKKTEQIGRKLNHLSGEVETDIETRSPSES
jgi:hypothetical protein